jgi:hypothetical protein
LNEANVVESGGIVSCDLICAGCDYDLRTLRWDARCPECNLLVRESDLPPSFRLRDRQSGLRLRRGIQFLIVAFVLEVGLRFLQRYCATFVGSRNASELAPVVLKSIEAAYALIPLGMQCYSTLLIVGAIRSKGSLRTWFLTRTVVLVSILALLADAYWRVRTFIPSVVDQWLPGSLQPMGITLGIMMIAMPALKLLIWSSLLIGLRQSGSKRLRRWLLLIVWVEAVSLVGGMPYATYLLSGSDILGMRSEAYTFLWWRVLGGPELWLAMAVAEMLTLAWLLRMITSELNFRRESGVQLFAQEPASVG